MKVFFTFLTLFILSESRVWAQTSVHPTIQNFAIKLEDGNPKEISKVIDSPVVVIYVVQLKKEASVNNICVKVSSAGLSEGNVLLKKFKYTSETLFNDQKEILYKREGETVYIRTVTANKFSDINLEVYTEDFDGKPSAVLNWKK